MSTPLESLKKNRKVPLNGSGRTNNAPYRKGWHTSDVVPSSRLQSNSDKAVMSKSRGHSQDRISALNAAQDNDAVEKDERKQMKLIQKMLLDTLGMGRIKFENESHSCRLRRLVLPEILLMAKTFMSETGWLRLEVKGHGLGNIAPTDMELLSSMAGRLAQAEQQLRYSAKEMIEKDKKVKILEDKVQLLEKARGYSSETVRDLERKCKSLQQQVYDMEEFLADYGMIWVGPDEIPSDNLAEDLHMENGSDTRQTCRGTSELWNPGSSLPSKSFAMDFNLVVKNIKELNVLCGGDCAVVSQTKGGATLKVRDPIPLTMYANGISMFSGPFRPYTETSTQQCMQDIMDGYFPSELESRYPDGIPFKVIDKREVVFRDRRTEILFPGSGQPLDGNRKETSSRHENTKVYSLDKLAENNAEPKVSVEKFLNNLPSSVIKNGKIIDVRSGIADSLKGSSGGSCEYNVTLIDTPVVQEIKSRTERGIERPLSGHRVTTLRIKSEKGDQTYILKLNFTDTIADVRKYINKIRPDLYDNYCIKTSFPNKVHEELKLTLEEAELVPNATLHILLRK